MTTTVMRDSIVGDRWIYDACQAVPVGPELGEDGRPTGTFFSGPVRLAFPHLFKPNPKPMNKAQGNLFETKILFPPYADLTPLVQAVQEWQAREFSEYFNSQTGAYVGLYNPFIDQATQMKFDGFTPDCIQFNLKSQYPPGIVDSAHNPVVEETRIYPGVWAIVAMNLYVFGKTPPQPQKGVKFGVQGVMLIGDDTNLGSAGPDAQKLFQNTRVTPPAASPHGLFAGPNAAATPPAAPGVAGAFTSRAAPPALPPAAPPVLPTATTASSREALLANDPLFD